MIAGIGIDLISPERFEKTMAKLGDDFLNRVFTEEEIEYSKPKKNAQQHFAARFAAKEAAFKAFGTGLRGELTWHDIAVKKDELGAVYIELRGHAASLAEGMGIRYVHLSIAHDQGFGAAIVVLEK